MERSYRGLGLVLLIVLVVAPLTLFAVLAMFEDQSEDSILLSIDRVYWKGKLDGPLLESAEPWVPGQTRSAIVYVKNDGPDPVDADVIVSARSTDVVVRDGYLTLGATVGKGRSVSFPVSTESNDVMVEDLPSGDTVPVTLTATFDEEAPIGATLDSEALRVRLRVSGTRTEEAGAPSLLDATGAQLWLAPVFLVLAALAALFAQARRGVRGARRSR
jgi:hypothetical protein